MVAGPQLSFENGAFIIRGEGSEPETFVALVPEPSPIVGGKFKVLLNGVLVSFDQRGLGVQYRGKGGFSGLTYVPTSAKAFSAPEIVQNAEMIRAGTRQDRATALSGFEIIGNVAYLLVRWEDSDGKAWLEAIVSVDASSDEPVTKFVGRFDGLTDAKGLVSDKLDAGIGGLVSLISHSDKVGVGVVALPKGDVSYSYFEIAPKTLIFNNHMLYGVAKTDYGTLMLSTIDESTLVQKPIFETRGEIVNIGVQSAMGVKEGGVLQLLSLESGSLTTFAKDSGIAGTPYGVLVWFPKEEPKSAILLERGGWTKVATWSAKRP